MHDYLHDAAEAAKLTDVQLIAIWNEAMEAKKLTGFQQAVLDEIQLRRLDPVAEGHCVPAPCQDMLVLQNMAARARHSRHHQ